MSDAVRHSDFETAARALRAASFTFTRLHKFSSWLLLRAAVCSAMLDDAIVIPRLLIGGLESPTRSRLSPRVGHVVLRPHDVRAPPLPAAHEYSPRAPAQCGKRSASPGHP